ncbi:uncharacterized protein [Primulina eburnea]|uniref:uncharacterized protein n=1 Tax=Primulina eburnea TaxID=1245227 RepID=UPI003C6BEC66
MMQLVSRKWRKIRSHDEDIYSKDLSLPTRDDSRPIDSQEQEDLVRSFEKSLAYQSFIWRGVFGGMILCYVSFLMFSIYQQTYSPWELRFHAYFMYEVDSWSIVAADLAAVIVCLMLITGLMHNSKHHHLWLLYSILPGTLLAIFWLHHMLRLTKFRWDAMWLPLGPLSGTAVCLYVDHLLNQSSEELRKLRGYMYAYKAY